MSFSIVNHVVTTPPEPGHELSVARLDGTTRVGLPQVYAMAGRLAARLRAIGIGPGDRIGILAANCLEWVLLDLAALRLKAVTAGFEPAKFDPDAGLLARYDLRMLFTDQAGDAPGVRDIRTAGEWAADPGGPDPGSLTPVSYAPGDVTTIKFTSGSTGAPKGLAATVGSIDSSMRAVQQMFHHGDGDNVFIFLPLSLLQQRYWVYSALCYGHDVTISTYEAAFSAMRRAQPTVVMGVPGFFEAAKKQIEARARRPGGDAHAAARALFGERIRYLWTGSAPANPATLRMLTDLGLPIFEGYGLNETCIVSKNHPGANRLGSVGQVLPGKQVLFDADGRLSVRCDYPVNTHYEYAGPGDSERMFGPGGIVHTGDLGYLDEDGFLYIRGRADDVIVLDNGRKVVVRPIEEQMKTSPAIEECVVFCAAQTRLVAVVSPTGEPADEPAIAAHLARTNDVLDRDERISKVVVAEPRFSIEAGTLTSQYKPKRNRIFDLYREALQDNRRGIHAQ